MFNRYDDITERIAERPKWWDEHRVPRYTDFATYCAADIYASEVALVEVACAACGERFEVAISSLHFSNSERCNSPVAEGIRKGDLNCGIPPNYGSCPEGQKLACRTQRVLEYWSRRTPEWWKRDSSLEILLAKEQASRCSPNTSTS